MAKEQEIANEEEVEVEVDSLETDDGEVKLDDDGNPVEEEKELEPWQLTEEDADEPDSGVPVDTHIRMKQKLKGRLKDQNTELDTLRAENERLKQAAPTKSTTLPPRPKAIDFDTDEEHETALTEWDEKRFDAVIEQKEAVGRKTQANQQYQENITAAVDDHYDRSAKLVTDSGINPDLFKESDTKVRQAIESIRPKEGDVVTDQIISLLGEGSEKVLFFLGRNKAALGEFQGLLGEDKTGMKALVYLGQQKERLTNPQRKRSSAPKPASNAKGDAGAKQSGTALKKKYDAAHKANNTQVAYNLKKQAKAADVDVSSW